MNSKIKIYCIILSVIYSILVIYTLSDVVDDFKAGYKEGHETTTTPWYMRTLHLKVIPTEGIYSYPEKITNTLTAQEISAEPNYLKLKLDNSNIEIPLYLKIFRGIIVALSVLALVSTIYLPFIFFSVVKSATKGKILEYDVIRKIQQIGYILVFYYLMDSLTYFSDYLISQHVIVLEKYRAIIDLSDFGLLLLGLVTLLMTEILKVSRQLKEEQDLTI